MVKISANRRSIKVLVANGASDDSSQTASLIDDLKRYGFEPTRLTLSEASKLTPDQKGEYDTIVVVPGSSTDLHYWQRLLREGTAHAHKVIVGPQEAAMTVPASVPQPYHKKIESIARGTPTVLSHEEHRAWMEIDPVGASACLEDCIKDHYQNELGARADLIEALLLAGKDARAVCEIESLRSRRDVIRDTLMRDVIDKVSGMAAAYGKTIQWPEPQTRTYFIVNPADKTDLLYIREIPKSLTEEAEATRKEIQLLEKLNESEKKLKSTVGGVLVSPPATSYFCENGTKVYFVIPKSGLYKNCFTDWLNPQLNREERIPLLETICDAHVAIGKLVEETTSPQSVDAQFYARLFSTRTLPKLDAAQQTVPGIKTDALHNERFSELYRKLINDRLIGVPAWLYWPFLDNIPDHYFVRESSGRQPTRVVRIDFEKPEKRCYFTGAVMGYAYEGMQPSSGVQPSDEEIEYLAYRGVAQVLAEHLSRNGCESPASLLKTAVRSSNVSCKHDLRNVLEQLLKVAEGPKLTLADLDELVKVSILERALTIIGFKADRIRRFRSAQKFYQETYPPTDPIGESFMIGVNQLFDNEVAGELHGINYHREKITHYCTALSAKKSPHSVDWQEFTGFLYDSGLVASQTRSQGAPHPSGG